MVLGYGLRVCVSNKHPLGAVAAGWCLDDLSSSETLGNINFPNYVLSELDPGIKPPFREDCPSGISP